MGSITASAFTITVAKNPIRFKNERNILTDFLFIFSSNVILLKNNFVNLYQEFLIDKSKLI
jgi:hypothetical protein